MKNPKIPPRPIADGSITAAKLDEYTALDEQRLGNLLIDAWVDDLDLQYRRYSFLRKRGTTDRGVRITWYNDDAIWDVWPIEVMEEGKLVPAWYPAWTPDVNNNVTIPSPNVPANLRYYTIDADSDYMTWTAPAGIATCDKIVITYVRVSGAGVIEILINDAVVGTVDTGTGGTLYGATATVTLSTPLAATDVVKIKRVDDVADPTTRFASMMFYDSDGQVVGDQERHILDTTAITSLGSSHEFAYSMKPTGDGGAYKWFGGYAHEGNDTYWQHQTTTETFTVDEASYTLAQGYKQGFFDWKVTGTARYDSDPTDGGTTEEHYYLAGDAIWYTSALTAITAVIDMSVMYTAMFPAIDSSTAVTVDGLHTTDITSMTDGDNYFLPYGSKNLRIVGPANTRTTFQLNEPTNPIDSIFVWDSSTYRKCYQRTEAVDLAIGDVARGGWGLVFQGI